MAMRGWVDLLIIALKNPKQRECQIVQSKNGKDQTCTINFSYSDRDSNVAFFIPNADNKHLQQLERFTVKGF
jgi:hypothetical protein